LDLVKKKFVMKLGGYGDKTASMQKHLNQSNRYQRELRWNEVLIDENMEFK
jgi:hypothetical protein